MSSAEQATGMKTSTAPASSPARKPPRLRLFVLLAGILVVVGAGFVAFAIHYRNSHNAVGSLGTSMRASGIPADISTPLANFMGLDPLPSKPAPDFTLADQHGHTVSLSSFRGHPVVLEFMDPHCTDICPLVSQEFVDAYRDLGADGRRVAFLAINVNQYHRSTASMLAFSQEHGLTTIPTWHFFTGPLPLLRSAWAHYGIYVHAPSPTADVIHSSYIFFIGPGGQERYLASPTDFRRANGTGYLPPATITEWGHGIAPVARSLLP